ncbi:MAG: hypothetical protein AMXMBFR82_03120 [Candidatus Hydrogenedentota bacterium]
MPKVRRKGIARGMQPLSNFEVKRIAKLGGAYLRKYRAYWPVHGAAWARLVPDMRAEIEAHIGHKFTEAEMHEAVEATYRRTES